MKLKTNSHNEYIPKNNSKLYFFYGLYFINKYKIFFLKRKENSFQTLK